MLGIDDPYVVLAYILCLASTVLCVIYGLVNWNRGDDSVKSEDVQWAQREKQSEEEV